MEKQQTITTEVGIGRILLTLTFDEEVSHSWQIHP